MLDSAKEWYYDANAGLVYIWLPTGDNPTKHRIEITARNYGIYANNQNNIVIRDLTVTKANSYAVSIAPVTNLTLDRLTVSNTSTAMNLSGTGINVTNSSIQNILNEGIRIYGAQNKIVKNLVNNVGTVGITPDYSTSSIVVQGGSSYTTVSENNVTNSGYQAIRFDGSYHTISRNVVDRSCIMLDDCAGINTWSSDYNNTEIGNVIDGNTISNSMGNINGTTFTYTQSHGIYLDDRRHDVQVTNNTITNSDYGIYIHNGYNHVVSNNRFYGARMSGIRITEDAGAQTNGYVRNNQINGNVFEIGNNAHGALYTSYLGVINAFGTYNNNTYCHPSNTSVVTQKNLGQNFIYYSLPNWRQASGQDANSTEVVGTCAPIPVASTPTLVPIPAAPTRPRLNGLVQR